MYYHVYVVKHFFMDLYFTHNVGANWRAKAERSAAFARRLAPCYNYRLKMINIINTLIAIEFKKTILEKLQEKH